MKRRSFLRKVGVGLGASLFYRAFAQGSPTVRWRLVSSYPRSLDTLYGGAEELAKRVAELTGGRFQIRVYQAGELVPGGRCWTRCSRARWRPATPTVPSTWARTRLWPLTEASPSA